MSSPIPDMIENWNHFIGWELINISLEYTAVAWVRLPRKFLAVVGVNLLTHPLFVVLLDKFGRELNFLYLCEGVIFLVEWLALVVIYGRVRWRQLGVMALTMNAFSFAVGMMIQN